MTDPAWEKPRRVTVLVDNDSWILPYAERLVREVSQTGDTAQLVRRSDDLPEGDVAFLLGCVRIVPSRLMNRSRINLVVHASDLPRGRGFSPMTWQILEGRNTIPICLFVAARDVDSGPVIFRDTITLKGTEVCEEWRIVVGERTLKICKRYLNEPAPPAEKTQLEEATFYPRRTQYDSRLDPNKTIAEQFGDGGSLFSCSRTSEPIRFWTHSSHERRQRDSLPRRGDQAVECRGVRAARARPWGTLATGDGPSHSRRRRRSLELRYVFFPHWSWTVPDDVLAAAECVCFHMTDVPYGRSGSPLQNLIARGHTETRLSALRMVPELDAGPVYMKRDLLLEGTAHEIFERCARLTFDMIEEIVVDQPEPVPQSGTPVIFSRRRPVESRLPRSGTPAAIYDHIRMLDAERYPRAFLDYGDFRLELRDARLKDDTVDAP